MSRDDIKSLAAAQAVFLFERDTLENFDTRVETVIRGAYQLGAEAERKRIVAAISEVSFIPWATIKQILALVEKA